jgi:hypothetical protein
MMKVNRCRRERQKNQTVQSSGMKSGNFSCFQWLSMDVLSAHVSTCVKAERMDLGITSRQLEPGVISIGLVRNRMV